MNNRLLTYCSLAVFAVLFFIASDYSVRRSAVNLGKSYAGSDYKSIWQEGQRICRGTNPYSRIHHEGAETIVKPATYLPGFYLLSCVLDQINLGQLQADQSHFAGNWIYLNAILYLLIGCLIFTTFSFSLGAPLTALVLTALFWNARWSLHTAASLQTNFIAILPIFCAFFFCRAGTKQAMVFSVSILFKQIAIFCLPIIALHHLGKSGVSAGFKIAVFSGLIPLVCSLPFIIDDSSGFFRTILYSAVRKASNVEAVDAEARSLVFLLALIVIYWQVFRQRISVALAMMLVMLCFVGLNRVFFPQYYLWFVAFLIVYIHERLRLPEKERIERKQIMFQTFSLTFLITISLILQILLSPVLAISDQFWDYWGNGEAEISRYSLEIPRYGQVRLGSATLIFVTEDFNTELQVKNERLSAPSIPVLKLNKVYNFQTGVYPYYLMLSSFVALEQWGAGKPTAGLSGNPIKTSLVISEWCGNFFSQLNTRPTGYQITSHSYFEQQADTSYLLPQKTPALFEDSLLLTLRGRPGGNLVKSGEYKLLTSSVYSQLGDRQTKQQWVDATLSYQKLSDSSELIAQVKTKTRSYKIWLEQAFPYRIKRWQLLHKQTGLTERAELLETVRSAYWQKNGLNDQLLFK